MEQENKAQDFEQGNTTAPTEGAGEIEVSVLEEPQEDKAKNSALSPEQKASLQKWGIYTALALVFSLSMYVIFAPEDGGQEEQVGLNLTMPQASSTELPEDKLKGYELGEEEGIALSEESIEQGPSLAPSEQQVASTLEPAMQQYQETQGLMRSFYEAPAYDPEKEEFKEQIASLKAQLEEAQEESDEDEEEEKQLRLMERSYQMASKYLPKGTNFSPNAFAEATERPIAEPQSKSSATAGEPMLEALTEQKPIVSSLGQPMTDSAFMTEYGTKERHLGFHSLASQKNALQRNTLRVVVDRTTTLQEGDYVALRLLETARIKDLRIPRGGKFIAQAKIEGNRMQLLIKSIEVGGQITPVKLSAYDTDGQEGIYIPGSENVSALKEMGANIGGSMGTSFTFASSAKDQIISEAARGVMQGASQFLQKKLRTVKVTLKGGYRLFLVQTK